jgi:hypothetical protein
MACAIPLTSEYRLFRKRLTRIKEVDALIAAYELEVVQFLSEVEEMLQGLKEHTSAGTRV